MGLPAHGKREILIGIEVAQITTDFPTIDLSEAIADIKASKPDDLTLQALKPPGMLVGQIDILLGIQYLLGLEQPAQDYALLQT